MVNVSRIVRMENLQTFLNQLLGLFVQKTPGKDLSTNDYTTEEKEKLAAISEGANNYVLPKASTKSLGGIIVGENLSITSEGVLSAQMLRRRISRLMRRRSTWTRTMPRSLISPPSIPTRAAWTIIPIFRSMGRLSGTCITS